MPITVDQRDTLPQAGLFVLLMATMLLGIIELLMLHAWQQSGHLPLLMTSGSAASITLVSFGLLSVAYGHRPAQRALALVLLVYSIALGVLLASGDPQWWIESSRVAQATILLMLGVSVALWFPPDTPRSRLGWRFLGVCCLVFGILSAAFLLYRWPELGSTRDAGITLLLYLSLVVLGSAVLTLLVIRTRPRLRLPGSAIAVGVFAVAFSVLGWLAASWLVAYLSGRPAGWQHWVLFHDASAILPAMLGLAGLWFSYHLVVSRALLMGRISQARQLELSEQRFRSLFSQSPDAVFALDIRGYLVDANPTAVAMIGGQDTTWRGCHAGELPQLRRAPEHQRTDVQSAFDAALAGRSSESVLNLEHHHQDSRIFSVTFMPIVVRNRVEGVFSVVKDLSERVRIAERMRILERSIEASHNAVMIISAREPGFAVTYVNPAFTRITGFSMKEVLGASPDVLRGRGTRETDVTRICQALSTGEPLGLTLKTYRRDGEPFWNQLYLSPVNDEDGTLTHFVGIMSDVTEHKEQQSQLAYQASHDLLTGLLNRFTLNEHLEKAMQRRRDPGEQLAVMFIDLDEFKPINDTLGHQVGDEVLVQVASRLSHELRGSDLLARIGGDEFILLPGTLASISEVEGLAERLLRVLRRPFALHGQLLYVTASIGISLVRDDDSQPERLIQQADMAMYKAKQWGRNTYYFFTDDLDTTLVRRVTLRNELQWAIEHDQLEVYYQPQADNQGNTVGLEALVRWQHPQRGTMAPGEFIPLAEQTGQIIALSNIVLEKACRDAAQWHALGYLPGRVSVNLSPKQFHGGGFIEQLQAVLADSGLPANRLEVEVTENSLLHDIQTAIDTLTALEQLGIASAIDDFGTGFSSLSYLSQLPIRHIKIDRAFIERIGTSRRDAAICRAVIQMAREMSLGVIAEGIETVEQFHSLQAMGCPAYQGFLFARPMSRDATRAFLEQGGTVPVVAG
ncbi:MAG: EAL domain-containing protein [Halomonas sp.]|uniref:putative bifunctional diguanylate cyclase/phosphodiesterase n=1 Tax=Halomonas sp. TaxID=1486246 RepID=UPI0028705C7F|nr:EAL domain-containing protein [Halomonas sp.]MDR9440079.1 EAL domain-containing protein [Halomonas sp.]